MNDNIKEVRKNEPNPKLIEHLKYLLGQAEIGEIQGMIGVVIFSSGNPDSHWVNPPETWQTDIVSDRIVGCLERMKFKLHCLRFNIEYDVDAD